MPQTNSSGNSLVAVFSDCARVSASPRIWTYSRFSQQWILLVCFLNLAGDIERWQFWTDSKVILMHGICPRMVLASLNDLRLLRFLLTPYCGRWTISLIG